MCLQCHFMNRPWMAGWLKNIHFEDRRNNFHSMLFPEASWFGCKLFLFYMKSLQSHPIILLSGWIKLFSVSGGRGKGKNMIWKQKELQNNYNVMTTCNKPTLYCLNQFPFICRCQLSISKYKENYRLQDYRLQEVQKKDTALAMELLHEILYRFVCLLSQIQMLKLLEKFWLPSATCSFKVEQQQKERQAKAGSLRVVTFNKWKFS